ncbi:MAG: sigma-70 family RNA polymerase sigma factor [Candidatus Paceibacterota bacterium]|jgi:RNA polymerase sigma-70 factor (ECF subfamily)
MSFNNFDEDLIVLFQKGERESFKFLVDKYTSSIFNFSARLVGRENASDIVQEVFLKVWKNLRKFDISKSSFKTWLFTITKNTITDFLRKRKNINFSDLENFEDEISFSETIPDEDLLPEEAFQKLQNVELLNNLLEKLPEHYKTILILHYQEEMTFDEIGKVLNKPLNTVKSHYRRAVIKLREMLK